MQFANDFKIQYLMSQILLPSNRTLYLSRLLADADKRPPFACPQAELPTLLLPHKNMAMLAFSMMYCGEGKSDKLYVPTLYMECAGPTTDTEDLGAAGLQFNLTMSVFFGRASAWINAVHEHHEHGSYAVGLLALNEHTKHHHTFSIPLVSAHATNWDVGPAALQLRDWLWQSDWSDQFCELILAKQRRNYALVSDRTRNERTVDGYPQWNIWHEGTRRPRFTTALDAMDDAIRSLAVIHQAKLTNPRVECVPVVKNASLAATVSAERERFKAERTILLPGEVEVIAAPRILIEL